MLNLLFGFGINSRPFRFTTPLSRGVITQAYQPSTPEASEQDQCEKIIVSPCLASLNTTT